jgi:hypothetical protein
VTPPFALDGLVRQGVAATLAIVEVLFHMTSLKERRVQGIGYRVRGSGGKDMC